METAMMLVIERSSNGLYCQCGITFTISKHPMVQMGFNITQDGPITESLASKTAELQNRC